MALQAVRFLRRLAERLKLCRKGLVNRGSKLMISQALRSRPDHTKTTSFLHT